MIRKIIQKLFLFNYSNINKEFAECLCKELGLSEEFIKEVSF